MKIKIVAALTAVSALMGSARADDRPFVFAYTTDIATEGEKEIEQEVTWASGHSREAYQSFESRTEFEYGVSDNFQASSYLNYDWERARPHDPFAPTETLDATGVSGEFIYRLMNPYFDPFGLALYAEPSIGNGSRSFEVKVLMQKNFFNDALRVALNINLEDKWEKNALGRYDQSSALEFFAGAAYNITPDWSAGVELAHERGFDGLIIGGTSHNVDDATFFGPTIQYVGHPLHVVLGVQAQLPWSSGPSGSLRDGYLADAERFRLRVRVGMDI